MRARALLVAVALLAAAQGCRRHRGGARRARDPRVEYATGCVDPRYVTAPSAIVATAEEGEVFEVATAAVGALRMVAWSTARGVTVAREGSAPVRVTGPTAREGFALAATGQRFVLAWLDGASSLQLASMDASGAAEAWPRVARDARQPVLAATRDGALLAWAEGGADHAAVRALRLDARGRAVGEPWVIATGAVDGLALASTGLRYVAAWRSGGASIMARAVPSSGDVSGPAFEVVPAVGALAVGPPAVAWGDTRLAVAWSDRRNGDLSLQVTTVDLAGRRVADPQRLSARFAPGARASLAWDGAAFGAAWWEPVGGGSPRAYMALVDRTGRRIGTPMRVGADDDTSLTVPVIAWQRPEYFLAAVRAGASVEARRTGPRGCDMAPAPGP